VSVGNVIIKIKYIDSIIIVHTIALAVIVPILHYVLGPLPL